MLKYLPVMLALISVLIGCGREVPVLKKLAPLPYEGNCRIAVLPFLNESEYPQGGAIVGKIFSSALMAKGNQEVIQEGDILELYRQLLIYPDSLPTREQLRMIGGHLNPELFVSGVIQKMDENTIDTFKDTDLTLVITLYNGKTGELLWTTYHHRRGSEYQKIMHLGRINTITGLARRMSEEIITDWLTEGMNPCTE